MSPKIVVLLLTFLALVATQDIERRSRQYFPFFNMISFPPEACDAKNNLRNGTCYRPAECEAKGGISSGLCAEGYGVCCIFDIGCGGSSSKNITYFSSSSVDGGICSAKICRANENICQFRLDFDVFVISDADSSLKPIFDGLATYGRCLKDTFQVWSGSSSKIPILCGTNSGYHMYLDASDSCAQLTFVLQNGLEFTREWTIRAIQLDCRSNYKAPDNCLQFFTGKTGSIESFNFNSGNGKHLADQDYSICIRSEKGCCSACFKADKFAISKGPGAVFGTVDTPTYYGCGVMQRVQSGHQDYIQIVGGTCENKLKIGPFVDRYCGLSLDCAMDVSNAGITGQSSGTICSMFRPYYLRFTTDSFEDAISEATIGNGGFLLNYWQQVC